MRRHPHIVAVAGATRAVRGRAAWAAALLAALPLTSILQGQGRPGYRSGPPRGPSSQPSERGYSLLWERNIFLSTRRKAVPFVQPPPRPAPAPADPRREWVFRGMLAQGDGCSAILESLGSGKTAVLKVGETFLDERIVGITLESVWLQARDDDLREIEVGRTLTGAMATAMMPAPLAPPSPLRPPTTGPASQPTGGPPGGPPGPVATSTPPGPPSPPGPEAGMAGAQTPAATEPPAAATPTSIDEQTLLERLRQRRMQETGGQP